MKVLRRVAGLLVYTAVLIPLQVRVVDNLSTDSIAYLRQAQYWAQWQTELMISAYWGPGFSWIIALFMRAGAAPLLALRLAMTVGGIVFVVGSAHLLSIFALRRVVYAIAVAICALTSLLWAVLFLSPDLLVAGMLCSATALLLQGLERSSTRHSALAGVVFGAACLVKAIALPLALALALGYAFVTWRREARPAGALARCAMVTVLTTLVVAAPWIAIISNRIGRFTISTSGPINHAIVSPDNPHRDTWRPHRFHPVIQKFHHPEPGRVTMWEEPSRASYKSWSPFSSARNLRHQLVEVSFENLRWMLRFYVLFDWARVTPLLLVAAAVSVFRRCGGRVMRALQIVGIPFGAITAAYLPVYGMDLRYYIVLFPFVLGLSAVLWEWLVEHPRVAAHRLAVRGITVVFLLAFAVPSIVRAFAATDVPITEASRTAHWIAGALRESGHVGPILGSAYLQDGGDIGLYVAYLLGQPWYGDEAQPALADVKRLQPKLVLAHRASKFARALRRDPAFRDLDDVLLPRRAGRPLRVKVYELQSH